MQNRQEVELNNLLSEMFNRGTIKDVNLLKENIQDEYKSGICSVLQGYCDHRGNVNDFEIIEDSFQLVNGILYFSLIFDEYVYLGCSDMDYSNEDIEIDIELKLNNTTYCFYGPIWPERTEEDF